MNNRRRFLTQSAATGVFYIAKTSWAQKSPGDTVSVAVVGFGGRGGSHISGYRNLGKEGVRVAALCDVDRRVLDKGVAGFKNEKLQPTGYTDIRKLLENKEIDAISIATPNHWHSLATIWGIQAGKDVYVEKPVSHNVWEGRQMVNAARKYGKIVQSGTQARSSRAGIFEAVKWVQAGNLGKIKLARGLCYKRRPTIGRWNVPDDGAAAPAKPDSKARDGSAAGIPDTVDYNLWCGPAPMEEPLHRKRLHYDWHYIWNYGNGDLGNQGIHQMDIARWFLGEMALSPRVWSVGGRLGYEDDGQTPNTLVVYHDYEKAPLIFEVRGLPASKDSKDMDKLKGAGIGVIVECENGYVVVPGYTQVTAYDNNGKEVQTWKGADDHFKNFIGACRSRRQEDLNADILEGHLSSGLCHTGNISYRLGKKDAPGGILEKIRGDKFAAESFGRMKEHLAKNEVDVTKDLLTLGPPLKFDPKTERFIDNDDANALVKDGYRKPFVVPEIHA